MVDTKDIDLDVLVQKMHVLCPNLPHSEEFNNQLRAKLEEQIKDKVPKVELEQLDLKYLILNVKNSLSEFQKRIDESVAQQQLRRTTRVRKHISQDSSSVINANSRCSRSKFGSSSPSTSTKADTETICSTTKCCHQSESDLVALVQVESLPVSASTNLVTIFVPTILQEKLHSVKYKISIDLNHLDMTKKILDLNLSQLESNLKEKTEKAVSATGSGETQECKLTYEIKDDNDVLLVEGQTQSTVKNSPQLEVKVPNESESQASVESVVCIIKEKEDEMPTTTKQRGQKRKCPKVPSGPPKKRGRKPGSKNKAKPEKSELAKYVEMFECNGNSPSSAVSQIVTSTTQNWDVLPDQTAQIAYFMNGEWTTLSAPSNNVAPTMVTTTNGSLGDATENENFIPFDDFVNFIDNQSLDIGNNVIARVLDGTVDNQEVSLNMQQHNVMNLGVENNQPSKGDAAIQFDISTKKNVENLTQPSNRPINTTVNSKEINPNVLALVKTQESNNVIFSTCRSMPSLDIEEGDLFCSTPQRVKISDSIIAFSMKPNAATASDYNSSFNQREDTITDFTSESDKRETLQSTNDSSGIGDISKNTPSKVKIKGGVVKEMSLLEIEKDFDDSLLDFENCLDDDLLSLAPSSCFNSPIDDRFADSNFIDVEEADIEPRTDNSISLTVPAPRSQLETSLLTAHEDDIHPALKNFKIPKVKPHREISSTDVSPEKLSAVKLPLRLKETETAINARVSSPFSIASPKTQTPNISMNVITSMSGAAPQIMSSLEISKIFGSMCYNFLADMCFENTCKYSHQLLDLGIISISVSLLRNEVLNSAYRFIWRHYKLFKFYFPIFCEEYGRRNMRRKLLTMVGDCQLQPKCATFLKNIYITLTGCGFSKVNACRFVLSRVRDRSHTTINVLLEIIIESDAQMFASTIEDFSTVEEYKFSMKNINELATICLRSGSAELVPALIKCLINVDQTEFLTMRSPELIQLLEMIKSSGGV